MSYFFQEDAQDLRHVSAEPETLEAAVARWGDAEEDVIAVLANPNTAQTTASAVKSYQDWQTFRYRDSTPIEKLLEPERIKRLNRFIQEVGATICFGTLARICGVP